MGACRSVRAACVRIVAGGPGSRWRARMLRTTLAEWTPCAIASAHAASTAGSPSVSTAARISTICRLPSSALTSLRRTRSIAAGSTQSLQGAPLPGDDPPVLADHDAIGIGVDLDRAPDRAGSHRVLVVVEAHQAGLRDRCRHCVESVEPARIGNELVPLRLEHLPDCLLGQFGMSVCLGVGDTLNRQPGVHLVVALEPQSRREEALANESDLVLDLTLLPA